MAIWKLTIEDDEGQKTVVPLVRDEYSLGRREGHTIRLTERNVSRDHARIVKNGEGYVLEDKGSYNGVFVNGHRLAEPYPLQSGDLIIIGDYRIEAHNEDAPQKPLPVAPVTGVGAGKAASQPPALRAAPKLEVPNRFVLLTGNDAGKEYPLLKQKMMIGRGDDVDVRVNHSSVSRHHCEVLATEDGRFEVLDQGSANGIRLNGSDAKRATLAAGDLLELGDVQLKFIPAGQPFVFDASVAEAAREIELRNERARRRSGAGTWIVVVLLVAAAAAGGVVLARSAGDDKPSPSTSNTKTGTPSTETTTAAVNNAGSDVLSKAVATYKAGDPVTAYAMIKDVASAKSAPEYLTITNAWADKRLTELKAEEPSPEKRQGLEEVQASAADEKYRAAAEQMLKDLEVGTPDVGGTAATNDAGKKPVPTTTVTAPATTTKPTTTATTTTKPTTTTTALTSKPTTTTTATTATPTVGVCPSYKGDYVTASKQSDWDCVRTILLPRLNAGAISSGEAKYLKAACVQLGDGGCAKRAAEKI